MMIMKKIFQLVIALSLTFGLGCFMASCSKDNPTETPSNDNSNLDVPEPDGILEVNGIHFEVEKETDHVQLYVTYTAPNGLYRPELITIEPDAYRSEIFGNKYITFEIGIGTYTVKAENLSRKVEVRKKTN